MCEKVACHQSDKTQTSDVATRGRPPGEIIAPPPFSSSSHSNNYNGLFQSIYDDLLIKAWRYSSRVSLGYWRHAGRTSCPAKNLIFGFDKKGLQYFQWQHHSLYFTYDLNIVAYRCKVLTNKIKHGGQINKINKCTTRVRVQVTLCT